MAMLNNQRVACHGFRMFFGGWRLSHNDPPGSPDPADEVQRGDVQLPQGHWGAHTLAHTLTSDSTQWLVHRDGRIFHGQIHAKRWKTRWKTRWKLGSWETFETWLWENSGKLMEIGDINVADLLATKLVIYVWWLWNIMGTQWDDLREQGTNNGFYTQWATNGKQLRKHMGL